jgi:O-antigen/teichoic acid export membrane protein
MLKKNVIANYFGQGWNAIMSLAFVPIYIKYLGVEAYGLIGMFLMLQTWLTLLDMGMKPALGREMARFTGGGRDGQSIWDILRSVEIIALGIAVLIALGIWAGSGWLATDWVQAATLPEGVVAEAFTLMGVVAALRFIENIYTSSLNGLQRQVLVNVTTSIIATIRGLGAVGMLVWVSPTLDVFFMWQAVVSLATVLVYLGIVYNILPPPARVARFSLAALRSIWRFAAGMVGIALLALLLTQVDKIILSRLLTLENFGYYSLAGLIANSLYLLANPIGTAFAPRFVELLTRQDDLALTRAFHLGAQLITVLMGSAALILMVFADRALFLWTADPSLTEQVAPIVTVLALGTFLNGLMWMPYQLQLAHGWTSLTIRINTVAVMLLLPTILWVAPVYGAIGAAWVWVALNAGYCVIGVHFMYRRILKSEKWIWYRADILLPTVAAVLTAFLCRWGLPEQSGRINELFLLVGVSLTVVAAAGLSAPIVRTHVFSYLTGLWKTAVGTT